MCQSTHEYAMIYRCYEHFVTILTATLDVPPSSLHQSSWFPRFKDVLIQQLNIFSEISQKQRKNMRNKMTSVKSNALQ